MAKNEEDNKKEQQQEEELELTFEPLDGDEESDIEDLDELEDDKDKDEEKNSSKKKDEDPDPDLDEDKEDDEDLDEEDDDSKGKEGEDDPDEDEGEDDPTIVESIIKTLGYEFSDEELEGLEDSEEGLTKLVDTASKKVAEDRFNSMVEASPNVRALYEFEQSGGKAEDFMKAFYPQTDYKQVEVSEDDIDSQKEIIRQSLKTKGLSDERINRNLQAIEDSGNLLDEAKDSLKDLRSAQDQEKERIKEQTEAARKQAQEEAEEIMKEVNTTLDKGNLSGIPLPKKEKDNFLKFIQVDEEKGYSQRDKKIAEMSLEEQLAIDAIIYHGLDNIEKIIDKKASSKSNLTLRERLKSNKDRGKNSTQDPDLEKESVDAEELDFRIDE